MNENTNSRSWSLPLKRGLEEIVEASIWKTHNLNRNCIVPERSRQSYAGNAEHFKLCPTVSHSFGVKDHLCRSSLKQLFTGQTAREYQINQSERKESVLVRKLKQQCPKHSDESDHWSQIRMMNQKSENIDQNHQSEQEHCTFFHWDVEVGFWEKSDVTVLTFLWLRCVQIIGAWTVKPPSWSLSGLSNASC